jgi:acyl-CoA-binding protein
VAYYGYSSILILHYAFYCTFVDRTYSYSAAKIGLYVQYSAVNLVYSTGTTNIGDSEGFQTVTRESLQPPFQSETLVARGASKTSINTSEKTGVPLEPPLPGYSANMPAANKASEAVGQDENEATVNCKGDSEEGRPCTQQARSTPIEDAELRQNMRTQAAVKEAFDQIVRWIHETPATPDIETSINDKLRLYGLYKHVTGGPCGSGDAPCSVSDFKAHVMYAAHDACRHLSTEQAMLEYVQLVASQPTWFGRKCQHYLQEHDTKVDELDDNRMDADYIFEDMDTVVAKASEVDSTKPPAKASPHAGPSDTDSVSTFATGPAKRKTTPSSVSTASKLPAVPASERSVTTTASRISAVAASERSAATIDTRFSVMDRTIQSMQASHAAAQQQMERSIQASQEAA